MFSIMAIKLSPRTQSATKVQEILTKYGCIIKIRLGLHETSKDSCSSSGLILLELLRDSQSEIQNLLNELNSLEHVTAKLLEI